MARVVLLCVFLSLQILQCLSQGQDPSVGEYFLEAVDLMNRTQWRYFLPEDTDIDQDGNLSDLEVQLKFNTYMGEVYKLIDQDKDNSITEEELTSMRLDIPALTKVVDIALENFPLRPFFLAADGNGDGVYDENDFFVPEKRFSSVPSEPSDPETKVTIEDYSNKVNKDFRVAVAKIGQNEGTVICKSLGYDGLKKVLQHNEMKNPNSDSSMVAYTCDGTEARLEDCQEHSISYRRKDRMGVVCQGKQKLGALRLVGGKDSSSGDIFLGKKGLNCNPGDMRSNSEVICRELGYPGVHSMTTFSAFTNSYMGAKWGRVDNIFQCDGTEQRLADCPLASDDHCYNGYFYGVVCLTDGKTGTNQGLDELIDWPETSWVWELGGRFLFIADANHDGKLTLEELATKAKKLVTKILEFLDEDQDGKISLEDLNLHLSVGPIQNLVLELFDDVTAGEEEFDFYNMKIMGQDMSNMWGNQLKQFDDNRDEKLNLADLFGYVDYSEKVMFLIPILIQKLDKNWNGKIHRDELKQFIDDMFNQLDMDNDDALTLNDVYILLREDGLDCLQVKGLQSFINVFIVTMAIDIQNFIGYIFHQLDMDGNGQITPTELEQMHVPCTLDFDRSKEIDFGSNAKRPCEMMFDGFQLGALIRSFPDSIFSERRGRDSYRVKRWGGDGHRSRGGSRNEPRKETLVDKLTNRACEMLS